METDIQKFYNNKNVFLTGGTGFLGKVFIEKILRVTEVKKIYVLIRSKKGKNMYERVNDIFKDPLFDKLHTLKKNVSQRVTPILGDCQLPNLGISDEDRVILRENVEVVMHSAATVRFNEPLSNAVAVNVRSTLDLIGLAKEMPKLKAFVHVSSAYANCNETHIEERFYTKKDNVSAENICKMVDILGNETIDRLSSELCRGYPNSYTFTKALAEEAVLNNARGLPICIFRPGIVISTCEEPVSGWIDNLYGPTSILYGTAYGVLHVMYCREQNNANVVPVDMCVNEMLACAWNRAKTVMQTPNIPPPIYNLLPDKNNIMNWGNYRKTTEEHGYKMPLTNMIWFPFLIHTESKLFYKLLCFIYHTIPGYIFDFALLLMGKKKRMSATYRKIHKQFELFEYFVVNDWTFSTENTKQLWQSLSPEDQKLFRFDMLSLDWQQYLLQSLRGMRRFLAKEEPATIPKGQQMMNRLWLLHRAVQVLIYGGGAMMLYWIF